MSRRPRSTESPVSLFTFLDVLMCTMGALILLLIGLGIKMRPEASMVDQSTPAPTVVPSDPPPSAEEEPSIPAAPRYTAEDRERELAERAARREKLHADLSAAVASARTDRDREKQQLRERRRIIAKTERKLKETQARAERASSQSDAAHQARVTAVAAEQKLKGLEEEIVEQIETTRRNLDVANRKQATASNEYALIPYDGTSGTMRRPIYIECTRHGYRFIPENEFVGPEHLDGFSANYNPLLTATQALLRYWNQRRIESGGQDPEPYVLLIVRPSGSLAYYLARELLAPVGANFGYELVEEDWKLAVGEPDPQARAVLRDAIDVTVEARKKIRETLAATGSGRNGVLTFNNNHRAISRGELAEGFEPGGRTPKGDSRRETGQDGGASPGGGPLAGSGGTSGAGNGGRNGPARPFADRKEPGLAGGAERTPGGGTGGAGGFGEGNSRGGSGRPARALARAGTTGARSGDGSPGTEGLEAFGEPREAGTGRGQGERGSGAGNARNAVQRGRPGGPRPATLSGQDFEPGTDDSEGNGGGRSRARGSGPSGDGGEEPPLIPLPHEVAPSRGPTPRALAGNGPAPAGRLRSIEPGGESGDGDGSDGEPGVTQRGVQGMPSARRSSAAGRGTGAPGGGDAGDNSSGGLTFGNGGGDSGERPPPGGKKRWGKSHSRAGIGLEQKLEIHAKPDRVLIGPNDAAIPVNPGDKTDELMQRVTHGIEQSVSAWGAPPANFYWLPVVKFVVYPGGNANYERLRGPLERMGVTSTVQYVAAPTSAKNTGGARP